MTRVARSLVGAIVVTAAAGAVALAVPEHAALVAHVWLVVVLALALGAALGRLRRALPNRPSAFDTAFAPAPRTGARPASLARIEREVTLATGTAFDVHYRLRPVLRAAAVGLLAQRGVDLDRSPARAERLLDPAVWELVRPDRPAPEDRAGPGVPVATIERAVDDLERLACN
jgi:hypothetical protein